jgi:hypothetical protein
MSLDFAKDFELSELVIESVTGEEWDISLLMGEINVYEDLFNATISSNIVIDDGDNRIKNIPITGHEWIRIAFRTPDKSHIQLRLRIYKISARELEKERRQMFILHCVDGVEFKNHQTRVSKAYKGKRISDIADNIQTEFLDSSFTRLETTKNLFHIIPGFWTPVRAINWLTKRATSEVYNGANYVYFQDVDGFNFCSLENLCAQESKIRYLLQPANIRDQEVETGFKPRTLDRDLVAVQSFRFVNNFDTLENVSNGMYGNSFIWHDIRQKQFGEESFEYSSSFNDFIHVDSHPLWTSSSDFGSGTFQLVSLGQPNQESHVKMWLRERTSQMQQIQNVRIHMTVPGDSDRRVGDIVEFWLPSPEALVENQLQMDDHYMGRYLVTSVRHCISKSQYITILELVKDSVFTALP